jgi:glutamine cyclotransferase
MNHSPYLCWFLIFVAAATSIHSGFCLAQAAPIQKVAVLARLPHSTSNYTEGFFYKDGFFYEGTGIEGHSAILVTEPLTGKVVRRYDLPPQYFGEGIVDWKDHLLEWTWKTHRGFVFDLKSLKPVAAFRYEGEGWGMTRTDKELVTSDGTTVLRFRDPDTFARTREIRVHVGSTSITNLNELEYVKGEIYANVWHTNRLARISPADGRVLGWIDCSGLLPTVLKLDPEAVLNGIAYDNRHNRLYVTGKEWPTIFQIRLLSPGL